MKLQINVSDDLVKRIDGYAKDIGISRSAFCAMLIGQGIMGYDKSMDIITELKDKIVGTPDSLLRG